MYSKFKIFDAMAWAVIIYSVFQKALEVYFALQVYYDICTIFLGLYGSEEVHSINHMFISEIFY